MISWDEPRIIKGRFLDLLLEDKLECVAGTDGMRPVLTYSRKRRRKVRPTLNRMSLSLGMKGQSVAVKIELAPTYK